MKTKAFIFFSLLICNLLPAQNVKLDIVPHFFGVRADSLFLSMDISVHIEDMDSKSAFILTPVLTSQEKRVSLPHIQLNGKQKQKLYLRNQILRKKNDRKEEDAKAYLIAGIDEDHSRTISYRTSLPTEDWMNNATLILKRTIVRPEGEQSLKDTIVITPQNIAASSGAIVPSGTATQKVIPCQRSSVGKIVGLFQIGQIVVIAVGDLNKTLGLHALFIPEVFRVVVA